MMSSWSYSESRSLKGALVGCGQVARYHLNAWFSLDDVQIVALVNRTREKALAYAEEYNIDAGHVYQSINDLKNNEEIDFVDIATAPHVHFQQVVAAARNGYHILCQKPFAEDLDQAQGMIKAAEDAGVLLSVNENWRWRRWYRKIKELLDTGVIGNPKYCNIKRHNNGTLLTHDGNMPALLGEQNYTKEMEHLLLYEWGIHIIDVSRFLFGECEHLYASTTRVSDLFRGEDRAILQMKYPDCDVLIDLSWASIEKEDSFSQLEYVTIEGDQGSIQINPDIEPVIIVITRDGVKKYAAMEGNAQDAYQNSYTCAIRHFISCLREGKLTETSAKDNLKTLSCLFAAYESAEKNRVVYPDEIFKRRTG